MNNTVRNAWGATIFCEDIRAEIGGKITLVGMYPSAMDVHVPFPFTLPKFGLWIRYVEIPNTISGDGKLYVWLPGDETASIESDVPMDNLRANMPPSTDTTDLDDVSERLIMLQMPMLISPLVLNRPGLIRVRMKFGEKVIGLGSLRINESPPPDATTPPKG